MPRGPRYTPEEVEEQMLPEIVAALYPIFHPLEPQDCAIQAKNHAEMTEIARQAWRTFIKRT